MFHFIIGYSYIIVVNVRESYIIDLVCNIDFFMISDKDSWMHALTINANKFSQL